MNNRKLGRFRVGRELIEDFENDIQNLMKYCFILEAVYKYDYDGFEYLAISDWFDKIDHGFVAPFYKVDRNKFGYFVLTKGF